MIGDCSVMRMTAKEELLRVRRMEKLLRATEAEIKKCRDDIYSIHVTDYSVEMVSGSHHSDIGDRVAKLSEHMNIANQYWDELIDQRTEVRKKIGAIENAQLRSILINYYIVCMSWEEISADMNYCKRQVRRLHKAALREYEKKMSANVRS